MAAFHFRMANNTNLFKYFLLQQNENGQFKRAIQEKFFKTGFSFITSISQQKQ